ncbi:MAG: AAA family ATPase [Actinobacteria bacterium]|nr:AAA family ATPase [Actinomycetota bacterium]
MKVGLRLQFGVLGPLVVRVDGREAELAGAKERALLAFLLLHSNQTVSIDRLIDALWPDDPPATARNSLQVYVHHVRKALGRERLVTAPNGYSAVVEQGEFDLSRFRDLVAEGRRARDEGQPEVAAERFATALGLWRGPPLPELAENSIFRLEIDALGEERLSTLEERVQADIEAGHGADLVADLEAAVAANPLRERLMSQLMLALYRAGRQVDALEVFTDARTRLVDELGLEPGPLLRDLHQRILVHDPALIAERRDARSTAPSRRTLSVVLGALPVPKPGDPEVVERALAEERAQARGILETRGAVVSTAGNTVIATFGLSAAREDDPHRAVAAASDLAEAGLRVAVDVGVGLATDAELVDAAFIGRLAALADTAQKRQVVLGKDARDALGGAVELRGNVLVSFDPTAEPIVRHFDAPLVGREREFGRLRESFDWASRNRSSHLVTILGPAGIGKSRLARELSAAVAPEATVLTGRCLAYGSGAFWPLAEMVKQAAGDTTPDALNTLLEGLEDRRLVVDQLAAALGTGTGMRAEDAFWALRKLFVALAADRPLLLVFEDLHWGEERLFDFIEELVERAEGAPVLVICLARPDLLDRRPAWGGGRLDAESIQLAPLTAEGSRELIHVLGGAVPEETRGRIASRAEGNPLFIEQLVALAAEDPEGPPDAIPLSIHGVLAARVDRLALDERALLEQASIIGLEFSLGGVAALSTEGEPEELAEAANRLVRKDMLRPVGPEMRGGDEYRFRHILIRDVVYGSILKSTRAKLHERFARWLERELQDHASELNEIVGYHLERAFEFRRELEPETEGLDELANEAGERLAKAGEHHLDASDAHAAINLLERARQLLAPANPRRGRVVVALAGVYRLTGQWDLVRARLDEGFKLAEAGSDNDLAQFLGASDLQLRLYVDDSLSIDEFVAASEEFDRLTRPDGPYAGRIRAGTAWAYALAGQHALAERLIEEVASADRRVRRPRKLLPSLWVGGPVPVTEAIRKCEDLLRHENSPRVVASCYRGLAVLYAMRGDFVAARDLAARDRAMLDELGLRVVCAASMTIRGWVELLAGQPRSAEDALRTGIAELEKLDATMYVAGLAGSLARALLEQEKVHDAWVVLESADESSARDVSYRVEFCGVRACLLARRAEEPDASRLARRAISLADATDSPDLQGSARLDLADVLRRSGQAKDAHRALEAAFRLFSLKGNEVQARRTQELLVR